MSSVSVVCDALRLQMYHHASYLPPKSNLISHRTEMETIEVFQGRT